MALATLDYLIRYLPKGFTENGDGVCANKHKSYVFPFEGNTSKTILTELCMSLVEIQEQGARIRSLQLQGPSLEHFLKGKVSYRAGTL